MNATKKWALKKNREKTREALYKDITSKLRDADKAMRLADTTGDNESARVLTSRIVLK